MDGNEEDRERELDRGDILVFDSRIRFAKESGNFVTFHPDTRVMHSLNETAYRIVLMCDGTKTIVDIIATVTNLFPETDKDLVQADVQKCLQDVFKRKLVKMRTDQTK